MASIAVLKSKVKILEDFTKVVNIQKIVVMKEIAHWQKVIDKSTILRSIFVGLIYRINKKYKALPKEIFEQKREMRIPIKRDLHFIFQGNVQDAIAEYEFKIIEEHCRKNNKPNDIYVIVGHDLSDYLKGKGYNIMTTIENNGLEDLTIYRRISHLIYEAYNDMIFAKSTLGFLDVSVKKFFDSKVFPFPKDQIDINKSVNLEEFSDIPDLKIGHAEFIKDFDSVSIALVRNAIESSIYLNIVKYSLAMKMRELQSLDDKEKNIKEEIEIVRLKMQRVRKDAITNELLTNATAFEVLSGEEEEY